MNVQIVNSDKQLEQAYHIRMVVFVEEQNVPPEEELDAYDKDAIHFIGYKEDVPIAASRLRLVDDYGKLERICVLKEHRGKSFGKQMIENMEKIIIQKGYKKAKLNAQTHAENFYQQLGYETVSAVFLDAGIPHVTMIKQL
ncbi:GNAT family N-acetyltransferase [Virgibacillus alimentarius]|uniref:GNAT family N-acyltransferase n=1 Tax=Virgibacillus alimentarius TaxID=698769 RepID=A0ABS4SAT8_9BACI|nr:MULTISPECIES: GNAT family N-acetyltransferase [Virgibacillus]MBP2258621.1 putative GNAT family N-acyltransferase [Virgibacillus alimentarius]HLR65839.1 GNAT family N-acetyltransferase [Virgibacillus sp.]